ncbi:MAG TPA: D-glycero-beta-D-manno-heptose-7-phosphate kinase [Alphaproteobacteria bacterium]|nr:D-glycero-beta-D-manno-heptose-7-phosphate kinase [Alphaproteobacteria bacterium]
MTARSDLVGRLGALHGARVLCIGDVMLDRFVYGEVERISPEAPVPVLRVERESAMLGGAGNVARNLAALGAGARFVSVVGRDEAGHEIAVLCNALSDCKHELVAEGQRRTTIKTRFFAGAQQIVRADHETALPIAARAETAVIRHAMDFLSDVSVVVLSDYGKGVLTERVVSEVIAAAAAAGKTVIVDPKGPDYHRYRGATLVTPNRKELAEAAHLPVGSDAEIARAAAHLIATYDFGAVLATRGADGMSLITREKPDTPLHLPTEAREVFDVTGAGDTVVATIAAALAGGFSLPEAAQLANAAAGIVVGKSGTAVAHPDELAAALHRQDLLTGEGKLVTVEQLGERVADWRRRGLKIGFTNGCFDLLHPGHVSLLRQARAAADRLVVGLNSDASVRRLKGEGRPVQSEAARAMVLGSLASVDLVVIFGEDTPMALIEAIKPDVLVKGADYTKDKVVGADFVEAHGGRVLLADLVPGQSTSATIARMAK